jgi:Transposase DDE domain group 1
VKKRSGLYPRVGIDAAGSGVVSQAGGVTLVETLRVSGLDRALSQALAPWRKPTATHHPAKVVCDLALTLAVGGDCLADVAVVRAAPGVYGRVASDPTVSRTVDVLAADARALAAIHTARAAARAHVWKLAGEHAPDTGADADAPVVIDVDATLVTAHRRPGRIGRLTKDPGLSSSRPSTTTPRSLTTFRPSCARFGRRSGTPCPSPTKQSAIRSRRSGSTADTGVLRGMEIPHIRLSDSRNG